MKRKLLVKRGLVTAKVTPTALLLLASASLLFCLLFPQQAARAVTHAYSTQATSATTDAERASGVELLRQGNYKGAVEVLRRVVKRNKADADAWHHLGLAYNGLNDVKGARKAFEQALKLRPDFVAAHVGLAYSLIVANKPGDAEREARKALALDPREKEAHFVLGTVSLRDNDFDAALREAEAALAVDGDYSPALILKTQALVGRALNSSQPRDAKDSLEARNTGLREAEESLEKLVRLNPNMKGIEEWREQLEAVRIYTRAYDESGAARTIFRAAEVTTKAVILSKPDPGYTERARRNNTSGTVRLRVVLGADNQVKYILVMRGLPDGLTEKAIAAARKIRFVPAIKDGRTVSTTLILEYNFNIF